MPQKRNDITYFASAAVAVGLAYRMLRIQGLEKTIEDMQMIESKIMTPRDTEDIKATWQELLDKIGGINAQ